MGNTPKDIEKMAELGRMVRGLVHDFNNSLASILGYAEFLASDLDPKTEQYQFAQNIRKAGLQLQDLIDQIRAFGIEKGEGKDENLNLVVIVESLVERMKSALGTGQDILFESSVSEALLTLSPHQFTTCLANLVRNAIESLEHRAGTVVIRLSESRTQDFDVPQKLYDYAAPLLSVDKDEFPFLKIEIIDTGCGMDEVVLNLAPSPHFTTKTADRAHGMGLPVAIGIIHYLDGGLTILTTPQEGTNITLLLPVDQIIGQHNAVFPIGQKSVLLIEDRDMVRHTIETMLVRAGHRITSFADGLMALDSLREDPYKYDLVITDFTMPLIDGKDLLGEIRTDFPAIPILVISGDSHHLDSIQKTKNLQVLSKPLTAIKLNAAILNVLS